MEPNALLGRWMSVHTLEEIYDGIIEAVDDEAIMVVDGEERYAVPWDEVRYLSEGEREYMDPDMKREIKKSKWKFVLTYFAILLGAAGIGLAVRWLR